MTTDNKRPAPRRRGTFERGIVLQGRFRIERFVAKGGAGEVYEAFDEELHSPVALKVIRPDLADSERASARFRREIALARQVTHPNVCRIFDVFRMQLPPSRPGAAPVSTLFLTMELLQGESLAQRIRSGGPLSEEEALPIIKDMCEGLKAAHEAGVIHRDFKSANVMLDLTGPKVRAVVTDFGLAWSDRQYDPDEADPLTRSGTVVGTPNYMAPEQLTGNELTPLVDTYALGIVIFEMVTGKRPFRGESDLSTAVKRLTEAPPSPRIHTPELSSNWESAILCALEREPEKRFQTLDELVDAFDPEIASPPIRGWHQQTYRLLGIAAAVAGVASLVLFLLFGRPDPTPIDPVVVTNPEQPPEDPPLDPDLPESERRYQLAVKALREHDLQAALLLFESAMKLEPQSPMITTGLAETWSALGRQTRAEQLLRTAIRNTDQLSDEENTLISSKAALLSGSYENAIRGFERLVLLFPEHSEHYYNLANAHALAGRPDRVFDTLGKLRSVSSWDPEDPRIDLIEASAAGLQGDREAQLRSLSEALGKAQRQRFLGWEAEILLRQAQVLGETGFVDQAADKAKQAETAFRDLKIDRGTASALTIRAWLADRQAQPDVASELRREAQQIYSSLESE